MQTGSESLLQSCIEKIEASYEYMLAYAAQGRKNEPAAGEANGATSIRTFVKDLLWGIENITEGYNNSVKNLNLDTAANEQIEKFKSTLAADAESAHAVVGLVLNVPSLSSQVIDNLNASTHVRSLLTDIFILDEVLKIHLRDQDS